MPLWNPSPHCGGDPESGEELRNQPSKELANDNQRQARSPNTAGT